MKKVESKYFENNFIKNLLPFLSERERRVLIMKAVYELTNEEIANIIGTIKGNISETYSSLKDKARKLNENTQIENLHTTD